MTTTSNQEITQYYDRTEVHYKMHWNLNQSLALHYGYWDASTKSFHEALVNTNKILAQKAQINRTDKVLDAGCGIGGSSIYLAQHYGCHCTGISLSEKQVRTAQTIAQKNDLGHLCQFEQADFTNTPFEAESFDVIWAVESVCHANNKQAFIQEAFRLLKKGGRLIMADFFQTKEQFLPKQQQILNHWAAGWAVPHFVSFEQFQQYLHQTGFTLNSTENATQAIIPSAKRLYYRFFPGIIGAKIYQFLYGATSISVANVWTAYYQYKALQQNLWLYGIVCATKP